MLVLLAVNMRPYTIMDRTGSSRTLPEIHHENENAVADDEQNTDTPEASVNGQSVPQETIAASLNQVNDAETENEAVSNESEPVLSESVTSASNEQEQGSNPATGAATENWTFFIYMSGSDLESGLKMGSRDLREMLDVRFSGNLRFVVLAGGTDQWLDADLGLRADCLNRIVIDENGFFHETIAQASMGNPGTLSSFLTWGLEQYPADHHALVLWGHGAGPLIGLCDDDLFQDHLSLAELRQALQETRSQTGARFDLIGFDACLMGTLEVAANIREYADYMIASEDEEPGPGWSYREIGAYLSSRADGSAKAVGEAIIRAYRDYYAAGGYNAQHVLTASLTDLNAIEDTCSAFDDFSRELYDFHDEQQETYASDPFEYNGMLRAIQSTECFEAGGYHMVDLGDLADRLQTYCDSSSGQLKASLARAVVSAANGKHAESLSGLTVVYPLWGVFDVPGKYLSVMPQNEAYYAFISELINQYTISRSMDPVSLATPGSTDFNRDVSGPADDKLTVSSSADHRYAMLKIASDADAVGEVTYQIWYRPEGANTLYALGTDYAIWDEKQAESGIAPFSGKWIAYEGKPFTMYVLRKSSENVYGYAPVKHNGEDGFLRFCYSRDNSNYGMQHAEPLYICLPDEESGEVKTVPLQKGDEITLLLYAVRPDGQKDFEEAGVFRYNGEGLPKELQLRETALSDGEAGIGFGIQYIDGREPETTPYYAVSVKDGKTDVPGYLFR